MGKINRPAFVDNRNDGLQQIDIQTPQPIQHEVQQGSRCQTPGGSLRYLHIKKAGTAPKCGDCGIKLPGIPALRPREYSQISRPKKTVQRAYGGSRCANCVRDRIVRAFLIEEQKIVKKVLKESQQKKR